MIVIGNYSWTGPETACKDLHLNVHDFYSWCVRTNRNMQDSSALKAYIRENRFITHGLIFPSLTGAAIHHHVPVSLLEEYMRAGFGLDLSVHMIKRKLSADFFNVR